MCRAIEEMRKETTIETLLVSVKNLMKNLKLTPEQAMDALDIPQNERENILRQI